MSFRAIVVEVSPERDLVSTRCFEPLARSAQLQDPAPVDQRYPTSLGHPPPWIIPEPVLEVVNCLKND
jgi:hypothetical protein